MTDHSPEALRALADRLEFGKRIYGDDIGLAIDALRALADRASAVAGEERDSERENIARILWHLAAGPEDGLGMSLDEAVEIILTDREAAISRAREEMRERCKAAVRDVQRSTTVYGIDTEVVHIDEVLDGIDALSSPLAARTEAARPAAAPADVAKALLPFTTKDGSWMQGGVVQILEALAPFFAPTPSDVDAAVAGEREYATFEDWLGETEAYSLRAERVPEGTTTEWLRAAFEAGRARAPHQSGEG